ncbi:MAG: hypothetical protein CM1200mP29_13980 [Verrucomicrobiota bacterium]|nr:MAG: hypothetical protein CM1200mP29_13980 [Verrucomicrobiota bacterium]
MEGVDVLRVRTRSELLDFDSPTKFVYESEMKVDAYGIIMLPGLGFHDCLRINEVVKNVAFVRYREL